jgi:hypothetical protein
VKNPGNRAMNNASGRAALIVLLALLGACAQQPDAGDVPRGADFSPRILADGTKLFRVLLREPLPERRRAQNAPPQREREADLKAIAAAMLAGNGYCRTGFIVLEQYRQQHTRALRGECREGADAGDRQRFAH